MRPAIFRTSAETRTASAKSPMIWVSAVRKRLPKLWPLRPRPAEKRYWKRRDSSAESSLSATMQLRISPGGKTSNSRRSRPELPPSSVTVTMAVISSAGTAGSPALAKYLSPCSSAESPVPPPIETTRSGEVSPMGELSGRRALPAFLFGVDQGVEGRLIGQWREIGVLARIQAIARFQLDGTFEVVVGLGEVAPQGLRQSQRVMDVVGSGGDLQSLLQVRAGFGHVAGIDQGNAVVVIIFRRTQVQVGLLEAPVAHGDVHARAIGYVAFGPNRRQLEQVASLFELARVEKLHGPFKAIQLLGPIEDGRRGGAMRGCPRGLGSLRGFGCLWFRHSPVDVLVSGRRLLLFGHNSQLSSCTEND